MRASRAGVCVRVAEKGSFTAVAEELGYTQSAISQQVRSLEEELGCILLERRRDGVRLTKDGAVLMPYLEAISHAEDALSRRQRELSGLVGSEISIGTFTSVSRNILPPLMKEFKEVWPEVHFVLRQGEYTSIADWVREGELDLGFTDMEDAEGLQRVPLLADEMMAVVPHGHRLAGKAACMPYQAPIGTALSALDQTDERIGRACRGGYDLLRKALRGQRQGLI